MCPSSCVQRSCSLPLVHRLQGRFLSHFSFLRRQLLHESTIRRFLRFCGTPVMAFVESKECSSNCTCRVCVQLSGVVSRDAFAIPLRTTNTSPRVHVTSHFLCMSQNFPKTDQVSLVHSLVRILVGGFRARLNSRLFTTCIFRKRYSTHDSRSKSPLGIPCVAQVVNESLVCCCDGTKVAGIKFSIFASNSSNDSWSFPQAP